MQRSIYLDFHATTPLEERALDAMMPFLRQAFGNPASDHRLGCVAAAATARALEQVASLVGAQRREVIFTSGATEAINLALQGLVAGEPSRRRIVSVRTEHPSVLATLAALGERGVEVSIVGVDGQGRLDLDELAAAVDERTLAISVSAANHEIGALAPLRAIGRLAHDRGALLHVDAAQAAGKVPLDVARDGVDLLSLSSHKLYGPKGVGALVVRAEIQHRLRPLIHGGGQERGLRSGTPNVPGIVGFGVAAEIAETLLPNDAVRVSGLRDRLLGGLRERLGDVTVNGPSDRLAGNLNVHLPGVDAHALAARCPEVAFSTGSACASMTPAPSPVLMAMGLGERRAEESVRLCVGRPTTETEVDEAVDAIAAAATALRDHRLVGRIA